MSLQSRIMPKNASTELTGKMKSVLKIAHVILAFSAKISLIQDYMLGKSDRE
jgi:hypothetical protein